MKELNVDHLNNTLGKRFNLIMKIEPTFPTAKLCIVEIGDPVYFSLSQISKFWKWFRKFPIVVADGFTYRQLYTDPDLIQLELF